MKVATELNLNLASTGKVVSRGNLFSHVEITGNLTGVIASNGDIGQQSAGGVRTGGITVAGKGNSTGQIIALGNIVGDVTIAGKLSGKIAAQGAPVSSDPVSSDPASRGGILGNITVASGFNRTGAILSDGQIGDAAAGTIPTIEVAATQESSPPPVRKSNIAAARRRGGGITSGVRRLETS